MSEDTDDEVMFVITPRNLRKWDLMAVGLQTVSAVMSSVSDGIRDVAGLMLRQSEYEKMRHEFHEDAAYELETLIKEVESGSAD